LPHFERTVTIKLRAHTQVDVLPPEDSGAGSGPGSSKQLEACMEELENVAGLSAVKEFVKSMRAQLMLDAVRVPTRVRARIPGVVECVD
jgi:hypothetical protein